MPEGHKTHRIAKDHTEQFGGQIVAVTSPQGRFRADARKVSRRELRWVEAVGKHLFYHFGGRVPAAGAPQRTVASSSEVPNHGDRIVQVHLGRYGGIRMHGVPPPPPVGQVRMRCVGRDQAFDLSGPTTCRVIDAAMREQVIAKLGPDPLAGGKKSDVWKTVQTSGKPIAGLLLDQSVVAGVGNIFRAEMLFEARLDPSVAGHDLTKTQFDRLWKALMRQMKVGLKYGKIVTVTAREAGIRLAQLDGKDRFRVYGNEHCPVCAAEIATATFAGRRLYYCPSCQSES